MGRCHCPRLTDPFLFFQCSDALSLPFNQIQPWLPRHLNQVFCGIMTFLVPPSFVFFLTPFSYLIFAFSGRLSLARCLSKVLTPLIPSLSIPPFYFQIPFSFLVSRSCLPPRVKAWRPSHLILVLPLSISMSIPFLTVFSAAEITFGGVLQLISPPLHSGPFLFPSSSFVFCAFKVLYLFFSELSFPSYFSLSSTLFFSLYRC